MGNLPRFWYRTTLIWWPRLIKNLAFFLDNRLACRLNLAMILVPMFHDTSFLGRLLSLTVRLIKIFTGAGIMVLAIAATLIWWLIWWLISPVIFIFWPIDITWHLINKNSRFHPTIKTMTVIGRGDIGKFKQQLFLNKNAAGFLTRLEINPLNFNNLTFPVTINDWLTAAARETTGKINTEELILAVLNLNRWRYNLALKTRLWLTKIKQWERTPFIWDQDYIPRPIGGVDRALIGVPTPTLDRFSQDLTRAAQKHQLPEMIGKAEAVSRLIRILSRRNKRHCLIIGEPGSGKSTLVKALAQEIVRGVGSHSLRFKRLVSLEPGRLAAGADDAALAERIQLIIKEINQSENIILFID